MIDDCFSFLTVVLYRGSATLQRMQSTALKHRTSV